MVKDNSNSLALLGMVLIVAAVALVAFDGVDLGDDALLIDSDGNIVGDARSMKHMRFIDADGNKISARKARRLARAGRQVSVVNYKDINSRFSGGVEPQNNPGDSNLLPGKGVDVQLNPQDPVDAELMPGQGADAQFDPQDPVDSELMPGSNEAEFNPLDPVDTNLDEGNGSEAEFNPLEPFDSELMPGEEPYDTNFDPVGGQDSEFNPQDPMDSELEIGDGAAERSFNSQE